MRELLIVALAVLALATPSSAGIVDYASQNRTVFASAGQGGGPSVSDSKNTAALGVWSETASAVYGDQFGSASASAFQLSNLADAEISMSGELSASGTFGYVGGASCTLDVLFALADDTSFSSTFDDGGTSSSATLFFFQQQIPYNPNSSGTLTAGNYELVINFSMSAGGGATASSTYDYDISFVPEVSSAWYMLVGALAMTASQWHKLLR